MLQNDKNLNNNFYLLFMIATPALYSFMICETCMRPDALTSFAVVDILASIVTALTLNQVDTRRFLLLAFFALLLFPLTLALCYQASNSTEKFESFTGLSN